MNHKAVNLIMERFFRYVFVTTTWFVNYCERSRECDPQEIEQIRTKLKEFKDLLGGLV